jgi:hypothetical protein
MYQVDYRMQSVKKIKILLLEAKTRTNPVISTPKTPAVPMRPVVD